MKFSRSVYQVLGPLNEYAVFLELTQAVKQLLVLQLPLCIDKNE